MSYYLGIRKSKYTGVYRYERREQYKQIAPYLQGHSMNIFDNAKVACEWVGTSNILSLNNLSNRIQPAVKSTKNIEKTGTWTCSQGHINGNESRFCSECGEEKKAMPIQKETPDVTVADEDWVCSCGTTNRGKSRFCTECGDAKPVKELDTSPVNNESKHSVEQDWVCSLGHTNKWKAKFCEECGEAKPAGEVESASEANESTWKCSDCGYVNNGDSQFCSECGKPRYAVEPNAIESSHETSGTWMCGDCGFTNDGAADFCSMCGKPKLITEKDVHDDAEVSNKDVVEPDTWICSLGHLNGIESVFCSECGEKRVAAKVPTSEDVESPVAGDDATSTESTVSTDKNLDESLPDENITADMIKVINSNSLEIKSISDENESSAPALSDDDYIEPAFNLFTGNLNRSGAINQIIKSFSMIGASVIKLRLSTGENILVALRDIYYIDKNKYDSIYAVDEDTNSRVVDKTAIDNIVKEKSYKKIKKTWTFPNQGYISLCDFYSDIRLMSDELDSSSLWLEPIKGITCFMTACIVSVSEVAIPDEYEGMVVVTDQDAVKFLSENI